MLDAQANIVSEAEAIRIITVMGHVDHGKTTFVDSLLAANNIISPRMAGKIRYLDSREDEQERGITMESSAVSLRFQMIADGKPSENSTNYIVNLIDTPGHVDFSTEVSTASRICDSALIVVDAVEGVCTQTISVLRQVWADHILPILVINKLDRLITDLRLSPIESYHYLVRLLEQVNAVMGSFFTGERMEKDYIRREKLEERNREQTTTLEDSSATTDNEEETFEEKDDEHIYFSPDRGNVIFCSAIHGWGFRLGTFARIFATRLNASETVLRKVLWGDYYYDPKAKRVIGHKHLRGRNFKPLFVQIILDNIWAVYESVLKRDAGKIDKIVRSLSLDVPNRELSSRDNTQVLIAIFSRWLPLARISAQAIIDIAPSPVIAQRLRVTNFIRNGDSSFINPKIKLDFFHCSSDTSSSITAYVSKMFAVPYSSLPRETGKGNCPVTEEHDSTEEVLLGFCRLYSGVLKPGMSVYCVLPKYDESLPYNHPNNKENIKTCMIHRLYIMMGRELVAVPKVTAGSIFAVAGLENSVWRNATLCRPHSNDGTISIAEGDRVNLVNLGGTVHQAHPIVRVALEPKEPAELPKLVAGLKLLAQADPCVETFQQPSGEHVILTAGEIHFERCLRDLKERFAKVDVQPSQPIVPFRECISPSQDFQRLQATASYKEGDCLQLNLRVTALPSEVVDYLKLNVPTSQISGIQLEGQKSDHSTGTPRKLRDILDNITKLIPGVMPPKTLLAFGPNNSGCNVLLDGRPARIKTLRGSQETHEDISQIIDIENSIQAGFQLVTEQGPLCGEPLEGFAFVIEELTLNLDVYESTNGKAQLLGWCISCVREACLAGLRALPLRLMLAMYKCEIQASSEVLGKVYAVISRRRGRIINEEMREGTDFFNISALLPVVESFGFALEIRKKTSGIASPQLIFAGYECLDIDPFWIPTTEEELEEYGALAGENNIAKYYIDMVRQRKGWFVGQKIVKSAEKQRNLKH